MNRIVEFYESYHFYVLALVIIVTIIITIGKNQQIKELLSKVVELKVKLSESKVKITEEAIIKIEKNAKSIKVGSLVRLKYILTGETITILISEYQFGDIENQSEFKRINFKMPLAVSLLNKEVGDIVKFKLKVSDENEVYVEVLKVGVENKQETIEVIVEGDNKNLKNESKAANDEMQLANFPQLQDTDKEISYFTPERIRIGSIVSIKYISKDNIILYFISKYESGKIEHQPNIKRLYYKSPLSVALLDKEVGDIVKFRLKELDENEVKVEVLAINNEFIEDFDEEIIDNELNLIMDLQNKVQRTFTTSKDMSEGFKKWLSRGDNNKGKNYALGTVTAYSSAINTLSDHYSKNETRVNIYNLNGQSIRELKRIEQLYGSKGIYEDIGDTAHGTYRNAMVAYVRFIESLS